MIEEMVGLGFKRVELSHGIRMSLVPGILKAYEEGLMEVSTVHNFCPLPGSVQHAAPNLYQPSTKDGRERAMWTRYTLQTLDFAAKLNTDRMVIHSGSVWFMFGSPEVKLDKWVDESELKANQLLESEEFSKQLKRALRPIRRKAKKAMPRVVDAYMSIAERAKELGICFCLENREGLQEVPLDDYWTDFLATDLPDAELFGYWHDTGHAAIKDQMGLLKHREHLEALSERLTGFHLHDVSESGRDHQVPGTGVIDFKMISEFVRPEHTLVLELSPRLTVEQVLQSRDYILSTFA